MSGQRVLKNVFILYVFTMFSNVFTLDLFAQDGDQVYKFFNIIPNNTSNQSRISFFSDAFAKAVLESPILSKLHTNGSDPPAERSLDVYKTYRDALIAAGVKNKNAESEAKTVADAVYLTLPFFTQKIHIKVIADSMALFLISQNILTTENAASYGIAFSQSLQKYTPNAKKLTILDRTGAISYGIVNFIQSFGSSAIDHIPAFSISVTKHFFAYTNMSEPEVEISVVSPPGVTPNASQVYGVTTFASTFLKAVDSSSSLQSVFYVNEPTSAISKAWSDAVLAFCTIINCDYPHAITIGRSISLTYDYMSKSTFVKAIAKGYALMFLGSGNLNIAEAEITATALTDEIVRRLQSLPSGSTLDSKIKVIFKVIQYLIPMSGRYFMNKFTALVAHIEYEFYASTIIRREIN